MTKEQQIQELLIQNQSLSKENKTLKEEADKGHECWKCTCGIVEICNCTHLGLDKYRNRKTLELSEEDIENLFI